MKNPNMLILESVVAQLEELANDFVFVGGAMVGLYIKDKAVPAVRATIDIDCVVEIISSNEYYAIAEKLRLKGFIEDSSSDVICRFKKGELILDVMPTDKAILGFSNKWYIDGVHNKVFVEIADGKSIAIFSTPYFLASKIEAFKGRGKNDFRASHDIEDIIAVFDGDPEIASAIQSSPLQVQEYLKSELSDMLANEDFNSCIEGHISDRFNVASRTNVVLRRMTSSILAS